MGNCCNDINMSWSTRFGLPKQCKTCLSTRFGLPTQCKTCLSTRFGLPKVELSWLKLLLGEVGFALSDLVDGMSSNLESWHSVRFFQNCVELLDP